MLCFEGFSDSSGDRKSILFLLLPELSDYVSGGTCQGEIDKTVSSEAGVISGPSWQPPHPAQYRISTWKELSSGFQLINRLHHNLSPKGLTVSTQNACRKSPQVNPPRPNFAIK